MRLGFGPTLCGHAVGEPEGFQLLDSLSVSSLIIQN